MVELKQKQPLKKKKNSSSPGVYPVHWEHPFIFFFFKSMLKAATKHQFQPEDRGLNLLFTGERAFGG